MILDTSTEAAPYNEGHIPGAYHCSVRQVESSTYAAYANNTIDYTDENLGNLHEPAELAALLKKYNITKETLEKRYIRMTKSKLIKYLISKMFNVYNIKFIK